MSQPQNREFMDTVQMVSGSTEHGSEAPASPSDTTDVSIQDTEIWPEASDFQCSESAALFAGTQPAPLTVV